MPPILCGPNAVDRVKFLLHLFYLYYDEMHVLYTRIYKPWPLN
jgi:hypothetical protein